MSEWTPFLEARCRQAQAEAQAIMDQWLADPGPNGYAAMLRDAKRKKQKKRPSKKGKRR